MCRIRVTWHDSLTVIFTVEEFCRHGKKKKSARNKSRKEFMKISRVKTLATEIFKTVNELNPNSMKTILEFNLLIY